MVKTQEGQNFNYMKHLNKTQDKSYVWVFLILVFLVQGCGNQTNKTQEIRSEINSSELEFNASNKELVEAFNWAKNKALSYAHDGTDPVGFWYEAALPNREAFCMRDVSHQAIGAEILGLGKHNMNMFVKFAQNISEKMDYCSYWEINRHDKPAPVDYENEKDFWYNLPANFDVTYTAYRLYNWTGNKSYLENPDLKQFYQLSMTDYVDHWDLGANEVLARNRSLHESKEDTTSRFGNNRGIPTYNEGGRGETLLGIDMTASLISAYKAYAGILKLNGDFAKSEAFNLKAANEEIFLDNFWWDEEKQEYRSILYADNTFDYFMIGENQAFLHYLYYFDVISDQDKVKVIVDSYSDNFDKLIVELKSYLPIMFYENGDAAMANKMIIDLCSVENKRRDYPENSFTVVEHITRGLMGLNVNAESNTFSTVSRVENSNEWAKLKNVPILSNKIELTHRALSKSIVKNIEGKTILWSAQFPGTHEFLYLNGQKKKSLQSINRGRPYSHLVTELNEGEEVMVSIEAD